MTRRSITTGYGLIVIWMFLPMLPVIIAGLVAAATGSRLDESGPHPTDVFGIDVGELLYTMGMMGWFMLLTFPTGLIALVVFTIVAAVSRRASRPA
jgi:hypothetical protein